ncbi:unnamed protein product [Spirodela intermedia]|uniref:Uncharacterized protein n=1 Tax=Spirodela intermedia TaxID=51605 RepID=A0A7I8L8M1_SPIIN|nr:unnamed protein product [Spirodela intermedia]
MARRGAEVRGQCPLHQNPKLTEEKLLAPRLRGAPARSRSVVAQADHGGPSLPPQVPANYKKLWPNRTPMGSDELIKHMSNVPCYLQRMEKGKGGTLQEKALNFGVLDWRRLERWTDDRRPVPGDGKQPTASPVTPSCRNSSSSLSYLTTLRNQRPSLNSRWDSSVAEALAQVPREASSSRARNGVEDRSPNVLSRERPVGHRVSAPMNQCKLRIDLEARGEEFRRKVPGLEDVSPEGKTSASTSKNGESSSSFVRNGRKPVKLRSDGGEGGRNLLHDGQSQTPRRWQCGLNDLLPEHLEGGDLHGSRRFSYSSTRDHAAPAEPGRASFVGALSSEDFQFSPLSPSFPRSCPLSGWPDLNSLGSDLCETSLRRDGPAGLKPNGGEDTPAVMLRRKPTGVRKSRCSNGTKGSARKRERPTGYQSIAGLSRCSSLREMSPSLHYQHGGDGETETNRLRRSSPLRRLLDPFLKLKASSERRQASGTAPASPRLPSPGWKLSTLKEPGLLSERRPPSSVGRISSSSDGDSMKGRRSPSSGLPAADGEDSIREVSRRQALLRVSWKDGVPLFTFSVNENEILAATRKKKGGSGKEGCECVYTFYYVTEARQKIRGWMKQGNRGKKELISNVVGQMNVSSVRSPEDRRDAVREFVLFGPELWPTFHETWDHPVPNSELAAVVLSGAPLEAAESYSAFNPNSHDDGSGDPSATKLEARKQRVREMVAILPSEVHGLSDTGKPATLVERWRSGGRCDCGGWDAGCALTILKAKAGDSRLRDDVDGTHRVELFIQGGGRDGRPFFSLVSFKEGLYRVDFDSSIAVVQAFAVCVSMLHGRKRGGLHELLNSRLCSPAVGFPVRTAAVAGGAPMSAPYRPPLSPVGRA